MREHPDHHDAELLLRLYDLRREARLRKARDWMIREFDATSLDDFFFRCPPGTEEHDFFRMTISYWEMVSSIVNQGLLKEEFFFENTSEFWAVWMKIKPLAAEAREKWKFPRLWANLETLSEKYEKWLARQAPEAPEAFRQRLREAREKR